jgi:hypothetical protein
LFIVVLLAHVCADKMNLLSRECSPTVPEINIENHGENHRENR